MTCLWGVGSHMDISISTIIGLSLVRLDQIRMLRIDLSPVVGHLLRRHIRNFAFSPTS